MKRTAVVGMLAAALSGCATTAHQPCHSCGGGEGSSPLTVPGVQGAWGQPVPMQAPYSSLSPGETAARAMMAQSVPLEMMRNQPGSKSWGSSGSGLMQASARSGPGAASSVIQAGGSCPSGGCAPGGMANPGAMMTTPPGMPLGPIGPTGMYPPGAVAASGGIQPGMSSPMPAQRTSVRFVSPVGMKVAWFGPGCPPGTNPNEIRVPARYNFVQSSVYRLKLSNIARLPGVDLYPTLEVVPTNPKTYTFLAHSSVPVSFTDEDFDQVASGNYVTKVIYLPDPQFQDLATIGTGEIVSTRLEPGADPVAEASRRGSVLLIVRLGNIDLEAPNTPAMDAPGGAQGMMPHGAAGKASIMSPGISGNGNMMMPPGTLPAGEAITPAPIKSVVPSARGKKAVPVEQVEYVIVPEDHAEEMMPAQRPMIYRKVAPR